MHQFPLEVFDKREAVHGLDGGELFLSFVVFATSGSVTEENPVGGFVAGPPESLGIDKGLQPVDGMIVARLPILGNDLCTSTKQVGCEMGDSDPRQQKESRIIGQQVAVFFQRLRGPAYELIPVEDAVWGRREGKAGNGSLAGKDQILQMFPDRLGVAEIVVMLDEAVEKLLVFAFSDLQELKGLKFFYRGDNQRLIDLDFFDLFP